MKKETKVRKLNPRPENEYLDFTPTKYYINWEFVIVWGFILAVMICLIWAITLI